MAKDEENLPCDDPEWNGDCKDCMEVCILRTPEDLYYPPPAP